MSKFIKVEYLKWDDCSNPYLKIPLIDSTKIVKKLKRKWSKKIGYVDDIIEDFLKELEEE